MASSKDYVAIAEAMHSVKPDRFEHVILPNSEWLRTAWVVRFNQWLACVCALALSLEKTNLKFDKDRFVDACRGN
jgi:hypothetical protein